MTAPTVDPFVAWLRIWCPNLHRCTGECTVTRIIATTDGRHITVTARLARDADRPTITITTPHGGPVALDADTADQVAGLIQQLTHPVGIPARFLRAHR